MQRSLQTGIGLGFVAGTLLIGFSLKDGLPQALNLPSDIPNVVKAIIPTPTFEDTIFSGNSRQNPTAAPMVSEALLEPTQPEVKPIGDPDKYNLESVELYKSPGGSFGAYERTFETEDGITTIKYFIGYPSKGAELTPFYADGATPTNASGDTYWTDGGSHRQTILDMYNLFKSRTKMKVVAGTITSYFNMYNADQAVEDSAGSNGLIYMVNPGRVSVLFLPDGSIVTGKFTLEEVEKYKPVSIIGGGPTMVMPDTKTGIPMRVSQDGQPVYHANGWVEQTLPFNPRNEDFAVNPKNLQTRKDTYFTLYPGSYLGHGKNEKGDTFFVMATIDGKAINGFGLMKEMIDMGCTDVIGLDSGVSTQYALNGVNQWPPFDEESGLYRKVAGGAFVVLNE